MTTRTPEEDIRDDIEAKVKELISKSFPYDELNNYIGECLRHHLKAERVILPDRIGTSPDITVKAVEISDTPIENELKGEKLGEYHSIAVKNEWMIDRDESFELLWARLAMVFNSPTDEMMAKNIARKVFIATLESFNPHLVDAEKKGE